MMSGNYLHSNLGSSLTKLVGVLVLTIVLLSVGVVGYSDSSYAACKQGWTCLSSELRAFVGPDCTIVEDSKEYCANSDAYCEWYNGKAHCVRKSGEPVSESSTVDEAVKPEAKKSSLAGLSGAVVSSAPTSIGPKKLPVLQSPSVLAYSSSLSSITGNVVSARCLGVAHDPCVADSECIWLEAPGTDNHGCNDRPACVGEQSSRNCRRNLAPFCRYDYGGFFEPPGCERSDVKELGISNCASLSDLQCGWGYFDLVCDFDETASPRCQPVSGSTGSGDTGGGGPGGNPGDGGTDGGIDPCSTLSYSNCVSEFQDGCYWVGPSTSSGNCSSIPDEAACGAHGNDVAACFADFPYCKFRSGTCIVRDGAERAILGTSCGSIGLGNYCTDTQYGAVCRYDSTHGCVIKDFTAPPALPPPDPVVCGNLEKDTCLTESECVYVNGPDGGCRDLPDCGSLGSTECAAEYPLCVSTTAGTCVAHETVEVTSDICQHADTDTLCLSPVIDQLCGWHPDDGCIPLPGSTGACQEHTERAPCLSESCYWVDSPTVGKCKERPDCGASGIDAESCWRKYPVCSVRNGECVRTLQYAPVVDESHCHSLSTNTLILRNRPNGRSNLNGEELWLFWCRESLYSEVCTQWNDRCSGKPTCERLKTKSNCLNNQDCYYEDTESGAKCKTRNRYCDGATRSECFNLHPVCDWQGGSCVNRTNEVTPESCRRAGNDANICGNSILLPVCEMQGGSCVGKKFIDTSGFTADDHSAGSCVNVTNGDACQARQYCNWVWASGWSAGACVPKTDCESKPSEVPCTADRPACDWNKATRECFTVPNHALGLVTDPVCTSRGIDVASGRYCTSETMRPLCKPVNKFPSGTVNGCTVREEFPCETFFEVYGACSHPDCIMGDDTCVTKQRCGDFPDKARCMGQWPSCSWGQFVPGGPQQCYPNPLQPDDLTSSVCPSLVFPAWCENTLYGEICEFTTDGCVPRATS